MSKLKPKVSGWWEVYKCGCISETAKKKSELLGYCGTHGADRQNVYPEIKSREVKP